MDAAERLTAYVDGELDAGERAAFEAELARDPVLRARVEALRRGDTALGTLRSPSPPEGFEERLRARLDATLAEVLGPAESTTAEQHDGAEPGDELAARRRRRGGSNALPIAIGVAAAAIVLVGGVTIGLLPGGGDDAESGAATDDAADSADGGMATMEAAPAEVGPTVVDDDRDLSEEDLDDILASGELGRISGDAPAATEGGDLARSFQQALGVPVPSDGDEAASGTSDADGPAAEEDSGADAADDSGAAGQPESDAGDAAGEGEAAPADPIARCVAELVADGGEGAIPAYVERATYEGTPAIVVGLVTIDPATERYSRAEVWVLERDTCQVLHLTQR